MLALPIDSILSHIIDSIVRSPRLVIEAPPGAGKTTRVPRALFDANPSAHGEIIVLEPRRLAARLAAQRVAEELGEEVGGTVGYTMRFEDKSSARTKIRFVTEGTLTRRLVRDPKLAGVRAVILDELHERHIEGDLALALLKRLQRTTRPDLAILAMSATLDTAEVSAFLDAPAIRAEGRRFEVAIEHADRSDERPLEAQIASALRSLVDRGIDGDVLVFLPGALEIRRAEEACAPIAARADLVVLPLHGSLSPAEQDRAVRPASKRKVILATNVAETSVTIDGVTSVVDSGLARVASHAPWSGLPLLKIAKIAKASAIQRAGRAGRTRPGRCLRLYTHGDYLARPEFEAPEVARVDLAGPILELVSAGVRDPKSFDWLTRPPAASVDAAIDLLQRLGAIDVKSEAIAITEAGLRLLRFPLHPRLGRLLVEAERRGVAREACAIAAMIGERDLDPARDKDAHHTSDPIAALDVYEDVKGAPDRARWRGIDPARVAAVARVEAQLLRIADTRAAPPGSPSRWDEAMRIAILTGYPDRVGRLRSPANATGRAGREIVLAGGGTASLAESSGVFGVDLVVAIDAEERTELERGRLRGATGRVVVRRASAIEADWLLEMFTDRVDDVTEPVWIASSERVEVVKKLLYGGLVLDETRGGASDPAMVARALAQAAKAKGAERFVRGHKDELDQWKARLAFAARACPELGLPVLDDAAIDRALVALCEGASSFAELRDRDLGASLRALLSNAEARALEAVAPSHLALPSGRRLVIHYPSDAPPWAESRLQDFFGMAKGPSVAQGKVPLVLHLLAPNGRAQQVTTDLAGFWERHYPAIARELRRKYPKHAWPDDPLTARPPEPKRRP